MSECLVTKLKASVADDTFVKLGVLRLNLRSNGIKTASCTGKKGCVLSLVSGSVTLTNYETGETIPLPFDMTSYSGYIRFEVGSNGAVVDISNKYGVIDIDSLLSLAAQPTKISDLQYCESITGLKNVTGDTSEIGGNFTELLRLDLSNTSVTGVLSDMGKCIKLNSLITQPSYVSGSIEDFVRAQRANGRTTCSSINMGWPNPKLTFNGVSIGSEAANKTLSWTETTITYDGTTIEA